MPRRARTEDLGKEKRQLALPPFLSPGAPFDFSPSPRDGLADESPAAI